MNVVTPLAFSSVIILLLASVLALGIPLTAQETTPSGIDAFADQLEYLQGTGEMHGMGNVRITYQGLVLTADEVTVNTQSTDIKAIGTVRIVYGDSYWEGEGLTGNLDRQEFTFNDYQTVSPPWYLSGSAATLSPDHTIDARSMSLSTCDHLLLGHPHWRMSARRIQHFQDGTFKAWQVTFRILGIPLFYLPYVKGSTDSDRGGNIHFTLGYRNNYGLVVKAAKEWKLNDQTSLDTGIIYRGSRGFALENTLASTTENTHTEALVYGMKDQDPLTDVTVNGRDYNGRFRVEEQRYRLKLKQRSNLSERLSLQLHLDQFSDNNILYEFYKKDFRRDPQPVSFAELLYNADFYELSLYYRPRVNDFESVVERLPELRLEIPRVPLGDSGFLVKNETTAAYLRQNWRDYDLPRTNNLADPDDYSTARLDTLNFIYYPLNLAGLNVIPRAGGRVTYYSETSRRRVTQSQLESNFQADDPRPERSNPFVNFPYDDDGGDETRLALELGVELAFKANANWSAVQRENWGINGLQHVLQPFVNYTWIPDPSSDNDHLYFFDDIDRVDALNSTRLGLRHRLNTQRDGRIYTLARMENFWDFYFAPESSRDKPGDFGTIIELTPSPRYSLWTRFLLDSNDARMKIIHSGATLGESDGMNLAVSYLYRDNYTSRFNYSMDTESTQILTSNFMPLTFEGPHNLHVDLQVPLNPKTNLYCHYLYDLERGKFGRQTYDITHDLHCWVGGLRFEQDDRDLSVSLLFYLKAFPKIKLDGGG